MNPERGDEILRKHVIVPRRPQCFAAPPLARHPHPQKTKAVRKVCFHVDLSLSTSGYLCSVFPSIWHLNPCTLPPPPLPTCRSSQITFTPTQAMSTTVDRALPSKGLRNLAKQVRTIQTYGET